MIVRAEAYLTEIEDKTGLIRRFHTMQGQLREVADCAEKILALNDAKLGSDELEPWPGASSPSETLIQE